MSITPPGFPAHGDDSVFRSTDQRLIQLEDIMAEYLSSSELLPGEKLTVAAYFDSLAHRPR